jgi:hypothetical protein
MPTRIVMTTMDVLPRCDGGPRDVVVTLGARGLCGMSRSGESRQYRAHEVPTVNAVGAGNSVHEPDLIGSGVHSDRQPK